MQRTESLAIVIVIYPKWQRARRLLSLRALLWMKAVSRAFRQREHTTVASREFEHVAGEVVDLFVIECNHGPPTFQQSPLRLRAAGRIRDQVEPHQRKLGSDAHHGVG